MFVFLCQRLFNQHMFIWFVIAAIPSRLEVLRKEVDEQKDRERQLQARFQQLQDKCFEATLAAPWFLVLFSTKRMNKNHRRFSFEF